MTIDIIKQNGNFSAVPATLNTVNETASVITINALAGDTKDPLFFYFDLRDVYMTGVTLRVKGVNGGKDKDIPLKGASCSIGAITTQGYKKDDGSMVLELRSVNGDFTATNHINFFLYSHIPVINH